MDEQTKERRARMRFELELGLTYQDIEILFDVPVSTAQNWRSSGRLTPLPSQIRSPRFDASDVKRLVGAPCVSTSSETEPRPSAGVQSLNTNTNTEPTPASRKGVRKAHTPVSRQVDGDAQTAASALDGVLKCQTW